MHSRTWTPTPMGDETWVSLWLGTEGGSVFHSCGPREDLAAIAARYVQARLVHPPSTRQAATVLGPCCRAMPDMACCQDAQCDIDARMLLVLEASLAMAELREWDAQESLINLVSHAET